MIVNLLLLNLWLSVTITASAADKRAGEDWWSLQALQAPEVPVSGEGEKNAIDAFVLRALTAKGLAPSPEADRRTLIRRLSFDLTGLPPSPEEVEAFVEDTSAQAYETLVDRLLNSPHYGERWARHWLDVVGFGESHGFEYNQPRNNAWPYRNWIVDALNANMPYDQFARYQLAGDVYTQNAAEGVIATGFLVSGPYNTTRPQSDRQRKIMDQDEMEGRLASVGQTFLGLTVNCARCHDHKYDPITIKDYYQLAATLAGITPADQKVTRPENVPFKKEEEALKLERRKLVNQRNDMLKRVKAEIIKERDENPDAAPEAPTPAAAWNFTQGLEDLEGALHVQLKGGAKQDSHGLQLNGSDAYAVSKTLSTDVKEKTLEAWIKLSDLNQKGGGAISIQTPNGVTFDAIVYGERENKRWMAGSNGFSRYDSFKGTEEKEADNRPVHFAIVYEADGHLTGYRDGQPYGLRYRKSALQAYKADDAQIIFGLRHGTSAGGGRMLKGTITQARFYDRALNAEEVAASAGTNSAYISEKTLLARLDEDQQIKRVALQTRIDEIEVQTKVLSERNQPLPVWAARPGRPRTTHVLARGNVVEPGEEVSGAGIAGLRVLSSDLGIEKNTGDAERRKKLAEWISHNDNPLFTRVMVNRLWHHHFGAGLVNTPNDFGWSGGRPSHPELLDWLAIAFKNSDYDVKALHRLIVTSATYRQSAQNNEQARQVDADNRLLWRKGPLRLEAEALRDAMLQVSGKLNPVMGGKGYRDVREYKFKGSHFYDPIPQDQAEQFRRTLYRFSPRGARRTILDTFDCPDPSALTPNRAVTTTPLQSLALMNNALVLDLADAFAKRIKQETGSEGADAIKRIHQLAFGRPASAADQKWGVEFVSANGLPNYCRVIFNANEFMYVR